MNLDQYQTPSTDALADELRRNGWNTNHTPMAAALIRCRQLERKLGAALEALERCIPSLELRARERDAELIVPLGYEAVLDDDLKFARAVIASLSPQEGQGK